MAASKIAKQQPVKILLTEVSGITSADYQVTNFASSRGLTPSSVFSVMIRGDSGYNQKPITAYYASLSDTLYLRTTASPTNGYVSLSVAYLA